MCKKICRQVVQKVKTLSCPSVRQEDDTWDNGGTAPRILSLGSRLKSAFSFTLHSLYP